MLPRASRGRGSRLPARSALLDRNLGGFDCVFLCNVAQFTADEARAMDNYLRGGGSLVFFLGDSVLADRYQRELGVVGEEGTPQEDRGLIPPYFRPASSPHPQPLSQRERGVRAAFTFAREDRRSDRSPAISARSARLSAPDLAGVSRPRRKLLADHARIQVFPLIDAEKLNGPNRLGSGQWRSAAGRGAGPSRPSAALGHVGRSGVVGFAAVDEFRSARARDRQMVCGESDPASQPPGRRADRGMDFRAGGRRSAKRAIARRPSIFPPNSHGRRLFGPALRRDPAKRHLRCPSSARRSIAARRSPSMSIRRRAISLGSSPRSCATTCGRAFPSCTRRRGRTPTRSRRRRPIRGKPLPVDLFYACSGYYFWRLFWLGDLVILEEELKGQGTDP